MRAERAATLFDAQSQRDALLRAVEYNANQQWLEDAYQALVHIARAHPEVFADDLWKRVPFPREARAAGTVWRRASRNRIIRKTSRLRASKHSHGSGKPVWESLIYEGRST